MGEKQVGCDYPDGTVKVHPEGEVCEMCAPVSEPSKDRDKAVEEARWMVMNSGGFSDQQRFALDALVQRAQEAAWSERATCIHPACEDTAKKRYPICYNHRNEPYWAQDGEDLVRKSEREECARVIERAEVGQFPRVILAEMIRNRSAARAPDAKQDPVEKGRDG